MTICLCKSNLFHQPQKKETGSIARVNTATRVWSTLKCICNSKQSHFNSLRHLIRLDLRVCCRQKARLAHSAAPKPTKKTRSLRKRYDTTLRSDGKRVVTIDGVVYEFEGQDGKKLKRLEATAEQQDQQPDILTPVKTTVSISGQQYVRTRNGNLVRRRATPRKSVRPLFERFANRLLTRVLPTWLSETMQSKKNSHVGILQRRVRLYV